MRNARCENCVHEDTSMAEYAERVWNSQSTRCAGEAVWSIQVLSESVWGFPLLNGLDALNGDGDTRPGASPKTLRESPN